jgi:hypothetical protein
MLLVGHEKVILILSTNETCLLLFPVTSRFIAQETMRRKNNQKTSAVSLKHSTHFKTDKKTNIQ